MNRVESTLKTEHGYTQPIYHEAIIGTVVEKGEFLDPMLSCAAAFVKAFVNRIQLISPISSMQLTKRDFVKSYITQTTY